MNELRIKRIILENFKGFKQYTMDFGNVTRIAGQNGLGKSSLATAIMWTLFGVDYNLTSNPNVRREVAGRPVNDVPVSVEMVLGYDGKEVTVKKTQKRSVSKDGAITDTNSYSINGVTKTLRDFNAYFDFDFNDLLMCMNPEAFLAQKPKEMREFLFKLPKDVTDRGIVAKFPELSELEPLITSYTVDEISAMNKATISKLAKEIAGYPGRIDEVNRQIVEDIDTAELELRRNAIKERINEIVQQQNDSLSQSEEMDSMQRNLRELINRKSEIENEAFTRVHDDRQAMQAAVYDADRQIAKIRSNVDTERLKIGSYQMKAKRLKDDRQILLEEYNKVSESAYPDYKPLPELGHDDFTCPTCGQELPEGKREQICADHAAREESRIKTYRAELKEFEDGKAKRLAEITEQGRKLRDEIKDIEDVRLPGFAEWLSKLQVDLDEAIAKKEDAEKRLADAPTTPDLSDNQEYEALCAEISAKERAIQSMGTDEARRELKAKEAELMAELDTVNAQISKAYNNVALENRLDELRQEQKQKEQAKADAEKIIDLLAELDRKKNEYLVEDINSHFGGRVTWKLFAIGKNGSYRADYCEPVIDGYTLKDGTANHGREIEAMVIIAESIQKIVGINAPVILDNCEALDTVNLQKVAENSDCQMIMFAVANIDHLVSEEINEVREVFFKDAD